MSMALTVPIDGSTKGLERALRDATGEIQGFGRRVSGTMRGIAGSFVAAFAGLEIAGFIGDSINAAGDLAESGSKAGQIFGQGFVDELSTFAADAATGLGMSQLQALDAQSMFGMFGKAAGLAGEDLVDFSQDFTVLAADMASFNNTSPEEAIEAIGAGLRGESEPLRRFGVLLDDATLKARAMELGIYDGTGSLDAQTRALAAAAEIMAQTSDQQGDFARTSDGLANQQRILKAQFENVKAELGQQLLPLAVKFFTWMNDTGIPVARNVGAAIRDGLGAAIEWAAAWWDEHGETVIGVMNRIWEIAQTIWPSIQEVISNAWLFIQGVWNVFSGIFSGEWGTFWEGIKQVFGAIWNNIKFLLSLAWAAIKYVVAQGWEGVKELFSEAKDKLIETMSLAVSTVITFFTNLPGNIIDALANLATDLYQAGVDAMQGLWDGLISMKDSIIDWVGGLAGDIVDGLKGALDIFSPSRVMFGLGVNIVEGLRLGMDKAGPDAVGSITGLANTLASPSTIMTAGPAGGAPGGPIVVQVMLDGRVVAESVVEQSQRRGGLPIKIRGGQ